MSASPLPLPTPGTDLIANVFDALPLPAYVVDRDFNIIEFNLAGARLLDRVPFAVLRLRGGRQLQCVHSTESADGLSKACDECIVKNFVREVFTNTQTLRHTSKLRLTGEGQADDVDFLITVAPIADEAEPLALLILDNATELSSLLDSKRDFSPASSSPGSKGRGKAPAHKTDNS